MIRRSIDSLSLLLAEYLKVHPVKPGSAEQLTISVNLFSRWYQAECALPFHPSSFSESLLNDFLHAMRESRGWCEVTANRKRRDLLTLWKFASRRDLVEHYQHEEVAHFREPEVMPTAFFQDELTAFLAGCARLIDRQRVPGWDARHDRAIAMVIYDTAFRINACLQLHAANLREDGAITALAGTQKTFCDEARWLGADTMAAIRALPPSADGRLFPWPYGKRAFGNRWKRILRLAGLADTRRDGPQKMRRTSASWYEAACPGGAQGHLGHKTAGLAKQRYIDPRIARSQKAPDLLPRIDCRPGRPGGAQRKLF